MRIKIDPTVISLPLHVFIISHDLSKYFIRSITPQLPLQFYLHFSKEDPHFIFC